MAVHRAAPRFSRDELWHEIKQVYTSVALDPGRGYNFPTGRRLAALLGYREELTAGLPDGTLAAFAGAGNPFAAGPFHRGETVVDIGSGAGCDALIAARLVGPTGCVIGFDMTPAMLQQAQAGVAAMGAKNVVFREAFAESPPLPHGFADVVMSNGVLNLTLDKTATLREWFRILTPGGRLQIGDIVVERPVPAAVWDDFSLWSG